MSEKEKKPQLQKKLPKILLLLVLASIFLAAGVGVVVIRANHQAELRRTVVEKQRQLEYEHLRSQGLSEEEINTALAQRRQDQSTEQRQRPWYSSVFRTLGIRPSFHDAMSGRSDSFPPPQKNSDQPQKELK